MQANLLRVIETGEFIKVGDTKTLRTNVRIIAATNKNLEDSIGKGLSGPTCLQAFGISDRFAFVK